MNKPVESSAINGASDVDSEFYIAATESIHDATALTLKQGNTFANFDERGDILDAPGSPAGVFHDDTRHLSGSYLAIDGHRPLLLSATLQDDNAVLTVDLANPDIYQDGKLVLSRETLHIVRSKFLWAGTMNERIAIQNFDHRPHRSRVVLSFAADFADLFEVRGIKRAKRGVTRIEKPAPGRLLFRYVGLDGLERRTRIDFDPAPQVLTYSHAMFDVTLDPGQTIHLFVTAQLGDPEDGKRASFYSRLRAARHALRRETARAATITSANEQFNAVLARSAADLYMLVTETPYGPYPYAGIPWFSTAFGRDGIITALETLWLDPDLAKGVLKYLAATQAKVIDPKADAEPGKILHETRKGEMAALGEVPFGLYYGSVDATPLFVILAGRYLARTGDLATIRAISPNIAWALSWMGTFGDPDGDGFVEYLKKSEKGLGNQGWKDSEDSIMHADGTLAKGPIALCEVQAYVFAAKQEAARIARALGDEERARHLEREAETLRRKFEAKFWCEELGTYALALDGEKTPCRVRASNAGHALFAGIASDERAARVADTLLTRRAFSGWGIRTLGADEARYNPMAYHNGSVWPHDNALIALGFARYGLKRAALAVFSAQFEAVRYMERARLPELFCGFPRRRNTAPTLYPVACSPQAWAAAAPFALMQAALGLECDHARGEIRFHYPELPAFIETMQIRGLRLGDATADIALERRGNDVGVSVLDRTGDIKVIVVQ
jgi:glycogen debranching enzyme